MPRQKTAPATETKQTISAAASQVGKHRKAIGGGTDTYLEAMRPRILANLEALEKNEAALVTPVYTP